MPWHQNLIMPEYTTAFDYHKVFRNDPVKNGESIVSLLGSKPFNDPHCSQLENEINTIL